MPIRYLVSTKTMTGRLAAFFAAISIFVGIGTFSMVHWALRWSEDRVSERRMLIDRDEAIARFQTGESGKITLDVQTVAYNDMSLLPQVYQVVLRNERHHLREVAALNGAGGDLLYKGSYSDQDGKHDLVLVSKVDSVELGKWEIISISSIVICLVFLLMALFGILLYRLSKNLIAPLNAIAEQLERQTGDSNAEFTVSRLAADEFKTLTRHLNQYRLDLHQTLKREQAFACYASHELRTPLTVAKGAAKLLSRGEKTAFQERQVTRITDAIEQMGTMVDALLAMVRYERNMDDAPLRTVTKTEIEAIIAVNASAARGKQLRTVLTFTDEPEIRATPAVLNMVLGNLIRNAVAITPDGEITIQVSREGVQVIDDGPGLGDIPRKNGHGLGLLIVDDLARRYGWTFTLANHAGRGCLAEIGFS
ncbi:histidine kinase dimerization/phospho-acceptor domain-containing protein [Endozoicomonas sp. ALC013]|uniref:sensor histidine kinase n=1 Tax=Endozoicomonas sp. ALC013 TaxID=3403076 RepID=UPI003BB5F932